MNPTKRALMIAGLIFVASAGYWYFSRPNEENDDKSSYQTPKTLDSIQEDVKQEEEDSSLNDDNNEPNANHIENMEIRPSVELEPIIKKDDTTQDDDDAKAELEKQEAAALAAQKQKEEEEAAAAKAKAAEEAKKQKEAELELERQKAAQKEKE